MSGTQCILEEARNIVQIFPGHPARRRRPDAVEEVEWEVPRPRELQPDVAVRPREEEQRPKQDPAAPGWGMMARERLHRCVTLELFFPRSVE